MITSKQYHALMEQGLDRSEAQLVSRGLVLASMKQYAHRTKKPLLEAHVLFSNIIKDVLGVKF